ncbi:unnamed protein product [Lathyrus sativus]|nr:unnamed protein product [Lathyrus sativus]
MTKSIMENLLVVVKINNVSNDETVVGRPSLMASVDVFKQHLEKQDSIDQQNKLEDFYSKSAFSTRGRVLETYRRFLKPKMAEALICTHNWLKSSFTYFKDLNLMEDFELSEDIIVEFEKISFVARRGSSQSQPQPSDCA